MEELLKTNFHAINDPINLTQYIRGKLFIYVDFLMSHEFTSFDKEIPQVITFLRSVIQLIAKWVKLFSKYIQSAIYYFYYCSFRIIIPTGNLFWLTGMLLSLHAAMRFLKCSVGFFAFLIVLLFSFS